MRQLVMLCSLSVATSALAASFTKTYDIPATMQITKIGVRGDGSFAIPFQDRNRLCVAAVNADGNPGKSMCLEEGPQTPSIAVTNDGGYFLYGYGARKPDEPRTVGVVRVNAAGGVAWSRVYGGEDDFIARCGIGAADGGLLIAGFSGFDNDGGLSWGLKSVALKIARDGSVEWQRTFDVSGTESFRAALAQPDGFVLVADNEAGLRVIRVGSKGNTLWETALGGRQALYSGTVLPDGDTVLVGMTDRRCGTCLSRWIIRLDGKGRVRWEKVGTHPERRLLFYAQPAPNGGVIAYGGAESGAMAFLFSRAGNIEWARTIATSKPWNDGAHDGRNLYVVSQALGALSKVEVHKVDPLSVGSECFPIGETANRERFDPAQQQVINFPMEHGTPAIKGVAMTVAAAPFPLNAGTACAPSAVAAKPPQAAADAVVAAARAEAQERRTFRDNVRSLLVARKFDELDRMGNELRSSGAKFSNGLSKLTAYYRALASSGPPHKSEETHVALVEVWLQKKPQSPAAATAAAKTYMTYYWAARGGSFLNKVTEAAFEKAGHRWTRADQIVRTTAPYATVDPEYHTVRVDVLGITNCEGAKKLAYDPSAHVGYSHFFYAATRYFRPVWCGTPEEYRRFAEYAAKSTKDVPGDEVFLEISGFALSEKLEDAALYRFDWMRRRDAFRSMMARHPNSLDWHNWFASSAFHQGDRATARELFKSPLVTFNEVTEQYWDSKETFEKTKAWAMTTPAESFVEVPEDQQVALSNDRRAPTGWIGNAAPKWPPIILANDLLMKDRGHYTGFISFVVNTQKGTMAVTALQPHMNLNELQQIDRWTMTPVSNRGAMNITAIESTRPSGFKTSGVFVRVPTGTVPAVRTLKIAKKEKIVPDDRFYIIGCQVGTDPCMQTAYAAYSVGYGGGDGNLNLKIADPVSWSNFLGSPVINDSGEAVGVVTTPVIIADTAQPPNTAHVETFDVLLRSVEWGNPVMESQPPIAAASSTKPPLATGEAVARQPLLIDTRLRMPDGSEKQFNAFLLETEKGPVAITALSKFDKIVYVDSLKGDVQSPPGPMFGWELFSKDTKWTLSVPGKPQQLFSDVEIRTRSSNGYTRAVVLRLKIPTNSQIQTLKPRTTPTARGERLFVIGCKAGSKPCAQTSFPAEVDNRDLFRGTKTSGWTIIRFDDEKLDWNDFVGSPVVDGEGKVVGVITTGYGGVERPKTGIAGARVEELGVVLANAEL